MGVMKFLLYFHFCRLLQSSVFAALVVFVLLRFVTKYRTIGKYLHVPFSHGRLTRGRQNESSHFWWNGYRNKEPRQRWWPGETMPRLASPFELRARAHTHTTEYKTHPSVSLPHTAIVPCIYSGVHRNSSKQITTILLSKAKQNAVVGAWIPAATVLTQHMLGNKSGDSLNEADTDRRNLYCGVYRVKRTVLGSIS